MYSKGLLQKHLYPKSSPIPIPIHDAQAFEAMHQAGKLAAQTLDFITPFVVPGVTTAKLDKICEEFIRDHGAIPAPLGYKGFPKATCISVNHVVCHGIPSEQHLMVGDILNIDVTVILNGWYGDTSRMFTVGPKIKNKAKRLIDVTYDAMMKGVELVRDGVTVGDIGHAIQTHAEAASFSVVRDFCGHGLGRVFHQPPVVLHFGHPGTGTTLHQGMFFTIEPMINAGRYSVSILADGWTAVTKDQTLSAQFEHSIGVTKTGYEIFTLSPAGYTKPPYKIPPS